MPTTPQRRKILVLADKPEIRKLLRVLTRKPNPKRPGAPNFRTSTEKIRRKDFDGVLLDLRCSRRNRRGKDGTGAIKRIQPSLMGRVLAITVEVSDPKSLGLVERYLSGDLPKSLLWLMGEP